MQHAKLFRMILDLVLVVGPVQIAQHYCSCLQPGSHFHSSCSAYCNDDDILQTRNETKRQETQDSFLQYNHVVHVGYQKYIHWVPIPN